MADVEMEPAAAAAVTIGGLEVLPWVEKYRPKSLEYLVAHKDIINTIERFIETGTLPHLLLHGPPGTGKTSTIMACAKKMYGQSKYSSLCLELNASDERGIGVVREQIKGFASARQLFESKHPKLIILDEADHMTSAAQFALRRVIETYHKNARFCLIGNYANKIIPALQSRCTRFRFVPLNKDQVIGRVREICVEEKVTITDDGLAALAVLGRGDMRRVLNILQATALAFENDVTRNSVYLTTGQPLPEDIDSIYSTLLNQNFQASINYVEMMRNEKGYSLPDILTGLFEVSIEAQLPKEARQRLMPILADIEHRLSKGASERVQSGAVVAAFVAARENMAALAKQKGR